MNARINCHNLSELFFNSYSVKVLVTQSCLTLCPHGLEPTVHGILQVRILEWVAIPFSGGSSLDPGMEPVSPALQADPLPFEPPGKPPFTLYTY